MTSYTLTLDEIDSGSLALAGGKGANLGELTRAGLPVPKAFCVSTEAYRRMIEANALWPRIASVLATLDYEDAAGLERGARAIRELILSAPMPAEIIEAVTRRHAELEAAVGKGLLVSVRSSATAEDLPGTSFAGQQDTYLNVRGIASVLEHVRRCWASLWTDRAISYRRRQGFRHEDVLLAVVVQEMFPSEVAGVLFTANPVTSNPDEMILNASWGLGEAIVSGRVNPDQFIVRRKGLAIRDRKILDKAVMTARRADGQGSEDVPVPVEKRHLPSLTDEQVRELCRIAVRIEQHYGFPQDIEWGWAGGRFAILQSREITAADLDFGIGLEAWQTAGARDGLADERWLWSRAYSDEVQTGPTSPLFYTYLQAGMTQQKLNRFRYTDTIHGLSYTLEAGFEDVPYFRWYGARAYFNLNWEKEQIRLFTPPFARSDALLWRFPAGEREKIRNMPFNWIRFIWIMLRLHVTNPRISLLEAPYHLYENLENWFRHFDAEWDAIDMDTASPREILDTYDRAMKPSRFAENVAMPFGVYLGTVPLVLQRLLERWCGDKDMQLYGRLVAGLHTKTSEENLAVWGLAQKIKASATLMKLMESDDAAGILRGLDESDDGRRFKADLQAFIRQYGHRGGAERDPIHHRWKHKPELVFRSIKPMLALSEADNPVAYEERLHQRMLETKKECIAKAGKSRFWWGPMRAAFLRWLIELVQDYMYYRDFERFFNDKRMSKPREMYTAIARNFIRRGLMQSEEDIFFLGKEEVVDVDNGKLGARDIALRVRSRRRVYDKYTNREPAKFLRGWSSFDDDRLPDDGKGLRGIAASSGSVTGRARVCRKLDEISSIRKGDILVTVATDPAWTTVFSIIGAVVVETGGVVAHAVMISREYGIPCVANLTDACNLIPDGAMITVDGTNGRVIVHEDEGK